MELSLREHLLLAQGQAASSPETHQSAVQQISPMSPGDNIDPAIGGAATSPMDTTESAGSAGNDDQQGVTETTAGKKGGRELSKTKRAAQNRAAQRAFRQRKEKYIDKLRDDVKDHEVLKERYKISQSENHQMRDYIINLQAALIDANGDYPKPPVDLDLTARDSVAPAANDEAREPEAMTSDAVTQLQQAAAEAETLENGEEGDNTASK